MRRNFHLSVISLCALLALPLVAQQAGRPPVPQPARSTKLVLLDGDFGDSADSALALALAVSSPELTLKGVVTVSGNTEERARLVWKELLVLGVREMQVGVGAPEPFLEPRAPETRSRQFSVLTRTDAVPNASRHKGAVLIADALMEARSPVILVAIGPLTNLALALKLEPSAKQRIERIIFAGGTLDHPDANILRDQTAAEVVFRSGVPLTVLGPDVLSKTRLTDDVLSVIRAGNDPGTQFLNRMLSEAEADSGKDDPTLAGTLAVALAAQPELDRSPGSSVSGVRVVSSFDQAAFEKLLAARLPKPLR